MSFSKSSATSRFISVVPMPDARNSENLFSSFSLICLAPASLESASLFSKTNCFLFSFCFLIFSTTSASELTPVTFRTSLKSSSSWLNSFSSASWAFLSPFSSSFFAFNLSMSFCSPSSVRSPAISALNRARSRFRSASHPFIFAACSFSASLCMRLRFISSPSTSISYCFSWTCTSNPWTAASICLVIATMSACSLIAASLASCKCPKWQSYLICVFSSRSFTCSNCLL
mmetsp:Transcript_12122/g.35597  ORF Transcript_12122/g.35597 Transcript_12122/m.35597 type:complete len:230 (+) Transcript_12122:763-1452(+)